MMIFLPSFSFSQAAYVAKKRVGRGGTGSFNGGAPMSQRDIFNRGPELLEYKMIARGDSYRIISQNGELLRRYERQLESGGGLSCRTGLIRDALLGEFWITTDHLGI